MEQQQPQIAGDPNLASEQAQASQIQGQQSQESAQADTAQMMARYGTRIALGGVLPASAPAAPIAQASGR